jgi:uncharacterized integral membrane protein
MTFDESAHNFSEQPTKDDSKWGTAHKSAASGRSGPSIALVALIILVVLALVFVFQNQDRVTTHFLFFTTRAKVWATIGIAIIVGILLDRLFSVWWKRRKQKAA